MNLPRFWLLILRAPGMMALRPAQLPAVAVLGLGATALHAQSPPVYTEMIDVDGIATRYHTAGLETRRPGQPVVVLQSGGGGTPVENWAGVLAGLQGRAAVLAYERPGIGGTSSPEEPLTLTLVKDHLRDLLKALQIAPPYILVGHSWGGLLILDYASRHPDEVAGSIYVDPFTFLQAPDDQREIIRALAPKDQDADSLWAEMQAMWEAQTAMFDRMPPGVRAEMELIVNFAEEGSRRDAVPPGHPITVLLAFRPMPGPWPPFPEWLDPMEFFLAERELTRTQFEKWIEGHANASVRVLPESSHLIPDEAPEAIVEAIDGILQTLDVTEGALCRPQTVAAAEQ